MILFTIPGTADETDNKHIAQRPLEEEQNKRNMRRRATQEAARYLRGDAVELLTNDRQKVQRLLREARLSTNRIVPLQNSAFDRAGD
jgi:hypothetical protein